MKFFKSAGIAGIATAAALALASCQQSPATPTTVPEHTHEHTHETTVVRGPFTVRSNEWGSDGRVNVYTLEKGEQLLGARISAEGRWHELPWIFRFTGAGPGLGNLAQLVTSVSGNEVFVQCWQMERIIRSGGVVIIQRLAGVACGFADSKRFQVVVFHMTNSQRIAVRMIEVRQRLNTLSSIDEPSAEESAEMVTLTTEYQNLEVRYRAAIVSEGDVAKQESGSEESKSEESVERAQRASRAFMGLGKASMGIGCALMAGLVLVVIIVIAISSL